MKFLENFSDRNPNKNEVKIWEDYLDINYTIFSDTEFGKMVTVDDKSYFLKDKSSLTDKIFLDVKELVKGKIHDPSLRRAIKNWIDKVNI